MRSVGFIVMVVSSLGCSTDPQGNLCVWRPGADGACEGSDTGSTSDVEYQWFGAPQLLTLGEERSVVVIAAGPDLSGYVEMSLSSPSAPIELGIEATSPWAGNTLKLSCDTVCLGAWQTPDGGVWSIVRRPDGWTQPRSHGISDAAPMVATHGELHLLAWTEPDGALELCRLDAAGAVISQRTVDTGGPAVRLGLAASAGGAMLSWERVTSPSSASLIVQLLATDGRADGEPLEPHSVRAGRTDHSASKAAFVGDRYRIIHDRDESSWFVIDPATRTVSRTEVGARGATWKPTMSELVPIAEGAVIATNDSFWGSAVYQLSTSSVVRVSNPMYEPTVPGPPPVLAPSPEGIDVAYANEDGVYLERRDFDLVRLDSKPTLIAEIYATSGCAVGGSPGTAMLALPLLGLLCRRRRWRSRCADHTPRKRCWQTAPRGAKHRCCSWCGRTLEASRSALDLGRLTTCCFMAICDIPTSSPHCGAKHE